MGTEDLNPSLRAAYERGKADQAVQRLSEDVNGIGTKVSRLDERVRALEQAMAGVAVKVSFWSAIGAIVGGAIMSGVVAIVLSGG